MRGEASSAELIHELIAHVLEQKNDSHGNQLPTKGAEQDIIV